MNPAVVDHTITPMQDGQNLVLTVPTLDIELNDVLFAHITQDGSVLNGGIQGIITVPAGWTLVKQEDSHQGAGDLTTGYVFMKVVDAGVLATASYTWVFDVNGSGYPVSSGGAMVNVRFLKYSTAGSIANSGSNVTGGTSRGWAAPVTPVVANSIMLAFIGYGVATITPYSNFAIATDNPAVWTKLYDFTGSSYWGGGMLMYFAVRPQTTSTGNASATSVGANNGGCDNLILIAATPATFDIQHDTIVTSDEASMSLVLNHHDTIVTSEEVVTDAQKIWNTDTKPETDWINDQK